MALRALEKRHLPSFSTLFVAIFSGFFRATCRQGANGRDFSPQKHRCESKTAVSVKNQKPAAHGPGTIGRHTISIKHQRTLSSFTRRSNATVVLSPSESRPYVRQRDEQTPPPTERSGHELSSFAPRKSALVVLSRGEGRPCGISGHANGLAQSFLRRSRHPEHPTSASGGRRTDGKRRSVDRT
jgi:hypothetical protein